MLSWQDIKDFFSKPIVWIGGALAAIGGLAAAVYYKNDFTRPPIPEPGKPRDYSADLQKLDPSKPIGVLGFNVEHRGHWLVGHSGEKLVINAVRNNLIKEMHKHYGDNVIVLDDANSSELQQFARQFNAKFGDTNPQVHFAFNHHQGTYDDKMLAEFLDSIDGKHKRAVVMACGPVSSAYNVLPDFDYIIIPRADGQMMGPELALEIGPAHYQTAIGAMRNNANAAGAQKEMDSQRWRIEDWRDQYYTFQHSYLNNEPRPEYTPPLVVTPPPGLPRKPKSVSSIDFPPPL